MLFSPIVLLVSVILSVFIKITSRGPILFKQIRIGQYGNKFLLYKFRTMKQNAETTSHQNHIDELVNGNKPMTKLDGNDSRLIPFAKYIKNWN